MDSFAVLSFCLLFVFYYLGFVSFAVLLLQTAEYLRMKKQNNKYLDYVIFTMIRLLASVVRIVPMEMNYRIADILGDLLYFFDYPHRRRAKTHLRNSFPDWSEKQIRQAARGSMRSLVYLALECVVSPQKITPTQWRKYIRLNNTDEGFELMRAKSTGVLMITGHFGNWEIGAAIFAMGSCPNVCIARPLDNQHFNDYMIEQRERTGVSVIDKKGASMHVGNLLKDRQSVGFVADQDAGRKAIYVDFFGRKASTFKSIALMAKRYNVPMIVSYSQRLERSFRFEVGIERIIRPDEWADKDDPLLWITQTYTKALEDVVRRDPAQYMWMHRRWKHRPDGTKEP